MLSNTSIRTRLYIAFGAITLVMIVVCGLFYAGFGRVTQASQLNIHTYQVVEGLNKATENLLNMETGVRGFALNGKPQMLVPFNEGKQAFSRYIETTHQLTQDNPEQQKRLVDLENRQKAWLETYAQKVIDARERLNQGSLDQQRFFELFASGEGKVQMDAMRSVIESMIATEKSLLQARADELITERTKTRMTLTGGLVLSTAISLVLGLLISRSISRPLTLAVNTADTIARGDLTSVITVDRKDETGKLLAALANMQNHLRTLVSQIKDSAASVELAASEIAQGNTELSSRTEEQAAALQQTAASMEQITATVRNNTSVAESTASSARETESLTRASEKAVNEMSQTMHSISVSAAKVKEITAVIQSIAFQTNILALNAAVEAARAGEHGRGFAVVASEVRTLAQRSASSSREIGTLIEEAVSGVEKGVKAADNTAHSILKAASEVASLAQYMDGLALASVEQMQGVSQVSVAVTQMDSVTQSNAALVEQSASASQSLTEQARSLRVLTAAFQI
ncbi:methyl-accepting chemotaxis protein [Pantoea ananatis]|jgi:methyl-accepting chemotaxis protein|uniref:Methyl-accepting chemotaxis citrate transducer Tcp n=1 Tax=Pantoea ananatis (strain AJ13355) TaxID=932677 RepID=A0A0H3L0F7_PANAA|nr:MULTISPECIES: methyl-accepting chemotaxis protein [Pantoea]ERM15146.1 Tcp [Pantoea ananatis BRT175]MCS3404734.1 methyl-accepting chemotaxis protein [Pantoea sp. B566]PQK79335.1 transcription factor [Pantoea ananatis]RAR71904.1 methyl-accepting chemotaxis protein [Pantoea ananatis]CRH36603.1 Methyl-accepting chemotaxis citrate transducer Tcp {ECO:0000313/EMBL:BAK10180.1} [Pantoea ananatis]